MQMLAEKIGLQGSDLGPLPRITLAQEFDDAMDDDSGEIDQEGRIAAKCDSGGNRVDSPVLRDGVACLLDGGTQGPIETTSLGQAFPVRSLTREEPTQDRGFTTCAALGSEDMQQRLCMKEKDLVVGRRIESQTGILRFRAAQATREVLARNPEGVLTLINRGSDGR
jgi:hypothetical protein